jgi:hypothetical protein
MGTIIIEGSVIDEITYNPNFILPFKYLAWNHSPYAERVYSVALADS